MPCLICGHPKSKIVLWIDGEPAAQYCKVCGSEIDGFVKRGHFPKKKSYSWNTTRLFAGWIVQQEA